MLNKEKHQLIMGRILKDIYSDVSIASLLGFKGGTCAYFFYKLPRFSVDLDFDILSDGDKTKDLVFTKINEILNRYGQVKEERIKRFTIFFLLSYGEADHNIKVEINLRSLLENIKDQYELKKHLGISILVAKKDYLFAGKLLALTSRKNLAMRDVYDIHYFAKNNWNINTELFENLSARNTKEYLKDCISFIGDIKDSQVLQGLGELVTSNKEKDWIKNHLKSDSIFLLKNYMSVIN